MAACPINALPILSLGSVIPALERDDDWLLGQLLINSFNKATILSDNAIL